MKKIRIGNDIRLKLTITGLSPVDQSDIKQVRCYLIDTTFGKKEEAARAKHARRFTREVFPEYYIPTPYNMHGCGCNSYHVCPANVCHYDKFLPDFHEYHWWPGYKGFGIYPDKFERYHRLWHGLCPFGPHHYENPYVGGPDRQFEPWYLAETEVLNTANAIQCIFPAKDQVRCGVYKLVVVITLFEQGWGKHNLRTYTIDKGDVFELVDDYTGESGNINLDVDDSGEPENVIKSVDTEHLEYTMVANDMMEVGGHDAHGREYHIYVELKDGTHIVYDPYDWRFHKLNFTSSDESTVKIDNDGTIYTYDTPHDTDNVRVTIRVSSSADPEVFYDFVVIVKNSETALNVSFQEAEEMQNVIVDPNCYKTWNDQKFIVENDQDGKYLWILSAREIEDVTSSGFSVPMIKKGVSGPFYYYRSAAAILSGEMVFVIKYA